MFSSYLTPSLSIRSFFPQNGQAMPASSTVSGLENLKLHLLHKNWALPADFVLSLSLSLFSGECCLVFSTQSGHKATSESIPLGTYLKLETGTELLHLSQIVVLFDSIMTPPTTPLDCKLIISFLMELLVLL